jgi:hypothetical protein
MTPAGSRVSKRLRWVVVALCQILVVVVLAEIAIRLVATRHRGVRMMLHASTDVTDFSDVETLPELMNRSMLGFVPGSVHYGFVLNSRSFRTREYEPEPAPDRVRIVALGDSFTFASGALPHEDHWTTLTERILETTVDTPVEVLGLGVPDTGPAFQLRLWQIEASELDPDAVVLAFFVGNDFTDHQEDLGVFGEDDRSFGGAVASVSALARLTRNLVRVARAGAGRRSELVAGADLAPGEPIPGYGEAFDPDRPTFGRRRFIDIESRRMALCLRSEDDAFDRLAQRVISTVLGLAADVEASGSRIIVMVIPDQYQIDRKLRKQVYRATGTRAADYDLDRPQRVLTEALETAGVEVVDLLPVVRRASRDAALYRLRDTHWNRRGNELAAAILADALAAPPDPDREELFTDGLEIGFPGAWSQVVGAGRSE